MLAKAVAIADKSIYTQIRSDTHPGCCQTLLGAMDGKHDFVL